ncbi:hypothetical protein ZHAS_00005182 [Anopheles sinensis]|uniref:Uncharacterized protein n=1 Tax=Anopheles sinensis TaxID=74873 RepID=A0A084VIS2_ANOSI|nr:hypothetical protein ZHAS_00005182 [Anopheles sinensis]
MQAHKQKGSQQQQQEQATGRSQLDDPLTDRRLQPSVKVLSVRCAVHNTAPCCTTPSMFDTSYRKPRNPYGGPQRATNIPASDPYCPSIDVCGSLRERATTCRSELPEPKPHRSAFSSSAHSYCCVPVLWVVVQYQDRYFSLHPQTLRTLPPKMPHSCFGSVWFVAVISESSAGLYFTD